MALEITSIFVKKRPILCMTEKKTQKRQSLNWFGDPQIDSRQNSNLGIPEPVRGSFQIGDQHIHREGGCNWRQLNLNKFIVEETYIGSRCN